MERTASEDAFLRAAQQALPLAVDSDLDGSETSPDQIYLEHAPLLRRIAVGKFGVPPDDASALVHDVFATYLANPGMVRSNLRNFLVAAICNASRNYWRARKSERQVFADAPEAVDVVLASEDLFEGLAAHLVAAATLGRLSLRCREALRRYYMDGEKTSAIADSLGTSPANVNYIMHVCRKRARAIYETLRGARA